MSYQALHVVLRQTFYRSGVASQLGLGNKLI